MSPEQPYPDTGTKHQSQTPPTSDTPSERQAKERADIEEDRRLQRELYEGELGGES